MIHVHLMGGPDDDSALEFDEDEETEDHLPDMIIVPSNNKEGELYEYSNEKASCGAPVYLYSGYDWSSILPFRKPKNGKHR